MIEQSLYYFKEQTACHGPAIGENVVLCWFLLAALAVYKQDKLRCELISLEADRTLQYKLTKSLATLHQQIPTIHIWCLLCARPHSSVLGD